MPRNLFWHGCMYGTWYTPDTHSHTNDMQIIFPTMLPRLVPPELKKDVSVCCSQKVTDCFTVVSLPNRLSGRCFFFFWGVQLEARSVLYRVRCTNSQPERCDQWQVWLAVWGSVISPSLDLWRSTCGRWGFQQAVSSWLRTFDVYFFLLSPDNGKFPRPLLP